MQSQAPTNLQQQLRDIHLPEPIGWWPPALGWWLVFFAVLGLALLIGWYLRRRQQANRYRKAAHSELQHYYSEWQQQGDTTAYLQAANSILKRVMRHLDPEHSALATSGNAWVDQLQRHAPSRINEDSRAALASHIYQAQAKLDVAALHQELVEWLSHHQQTARKP